MSYALNIARKTLSRARLPRSARSLEGFCVCVCVCLCVCVCVCVCVYLQDLLSQGENLSDSKQFSRETSTAAASEIQAEREVERELQ